MTKALGGTLFYWHMNYIMGNVVPEYARALIHPSIKRFCVDLMFDNIKSREGIMQAVIPYPYRIRVIRVTHSVILTHVG